MRKILCLCLMSGLLAASGCTSSTEPVGGPFITVEPRGPVSMDKNDYPVFPDADSGADPAVSAEMGGAGFTGEGWETNTDFDFIGDPRAVKGGRFRQYMLDFPGTLRTVGPETTAWNSLVEGMVYETLLGLHPTTLEYYPALATHWQVSEDKLTYRYRLDPNARWSDGQPVTAEDVVATWSFLLDPGLQNPMERLVWEKFEKPVAESKYIVRVTSKKINWRNFLYFSASLPLLPAHLLKDIDGETYLREYNFRLLPGTGPYQINQEEVDKGKSVTIRRRKDYWGESYRRNVGLNNFDQIRDIVVRDENLAFEMFKRGDLDYYYVSRAQMWVEELDFDRVQRGLIQKRKIFNNNPNGVQGLAFNTRKAPFSDIRVRQAVTLLFNRELMIEKLFYNEYFPQNSYYAGSVYENPENPKNHYDPQEALRLLAEVGWKDRDSRGRLLKNGTPLNLELLYATKTSETYLTVFQEDLRKVGISLNLRLVTFATLIKLLDERKFDLVAIAFTGLVFPNPETSYHSSLADVDNTNNITGIKNSRIDEICDAYDGMFDVSERIAAIREIDGILANENLYILQWYGPFQRITYWNKLGHPQGYISRIGDQRDLPSMWWIDPIKEQTLTRARGDSSITLEMGPTEDRYWLEYTALDESQPPAKQ
ncbi:extracellular solute-binding protein [Acidobacteria bacterium AH-259-D05]|nr:extracellular solute-binding protein [Acidobacteria bacterium AH-259-D05]